MARGKFPLTEYVIAVMGATTEQLKRANPAKMAEKYGIRETDAAAYIDQEMMMRGANRKG